MVPGVIVYVYIGSTLANVSDAVQGNFSGGWLQLTLLIGGTIIAFVGVTIISFISGKALKKALKEPKVEHKERVYNIRPENREEQKDLDERNIDSDDFKSVDRDI